MGLLSSSKSSTTNNAYTYDNSRQMAAYGDGWLVGDDSTVNYHVENSDYRVAVAGFDSIGRVAQSAINTVGGMGGRAFDLAEMSLDNNLALSGQVSNLKAGVDGSSRTINNLMAVLAVGAMAYVVIKR